MKPKIGVVFPKITDKDIADLEIEKIRVSKNRRKIGILLGSDTSAYQQAKVESEVKKACNLTEVIVRVDNRIKQQDKNVMIYEVEPGHEGTMQSASSGPKIKGKANVSDMLYGRPINDDIISIHSINDNSGRVVFSGKVFFVEDRDIKSKKTGKEFHLITMDITDNEDSISAKMFVTKTEDDEPFNKLFSKLKKGVKGGGIYIVARGKAQFDQYAGETIVMINDIAEIEKPPVRMDEASEKRVELHLHTQMSAMDAVSSVNDLINRAIYWGHKAIAVTDHGVVQSFPDAMKASNFNEKIKIIKELFISSKLNKNEIYELNASLDFFQKEFFNLDSRTKGILISEITRITNTFISDYDVLNTFCSPKEKLSFDGFSSVINEGKIVVLNMNIAEYSLLSKIIAAYLKLDFQTEVLQNLSNNKSKISVFICDEYDKYCTKTDGDFFSVSREAKCINIVSTQSYSSLKNALKDDASVKVIIQNLINKIWFRTDDLFTIEEAQKQLGKEEKVKISRSISESAKETKFSYITNTLNSQGSNISESYNSYKQNDFIFETNFFTQNLETFTALTFLSDGNKIYKPSKIKLYPYFKERD